MGRDGIEPSTSGLKDALLPLHDSKRHIGAQTNSLISETEDVINPASRSVPWCRCELVSAPNLHRGCVQKSVPPDQRIFGITAPLGQCSFPRVNECVDRIVEHDILIDKRHMSTLRQNGHLRPADIEMHFLSHRQGNLIMLAGDD
jgi:hypothetical protein